MQFTAMIRTTLEALRLGYVARFAYSQTYYRLSSAGSSHPDRYFSIPIRPSPMIHKFL
jgi:hypothetical protein